MSPRQSSACCRLARWPTAAGAYEKLEEEIAELRAADDPDDVVDELGDVLFCVVNVARHLGQDPEVALRAAVAKFRRRFAAVERLAAARRLDLSAMDLAALDTLWDQAKSEL